MIYYIYALIDPTDNNIKRKYVKVGCKIDLKNPTKILF